MVERNRQMHIDVVAEGANAQAELGPLRASLALGSYLLGRLTLTEASEVAGMSDEDFKRLVGTAIDASAVPAADGANGHPLLSVVIPVYNEAENIVPLYERLSSTLGQLGGSEIIFVDDGSGDSSAEIVLDLRKRDSSVKLIRLSRNFGHQAALSAGLDHARGQAVVFMDADLQDPPELITELVREWRAGHEVVYAVRRKRKEALVKRLGYFVFYRLLQPLAETQIPLDAGDYCLIDGKVAEAMRALPERNRFLRGLRSWVGFKQIGVPYDRPARLSGEAKYTMRRLVKLALDGLLAFSSTPLRLASYLGFVTAAAGVVYTLVAVFAKLLTGNVPAGWTSIVALLLTVGGIQLIMTGVVGEYLARVYTETKGRPLYVIREAHGLHRRR